MPTMLEGRRSETELLDGLLGAVRDGESRVLVLRGEAGVGKSVLLDYVSEHATGCRIARAAGVQSEMELPFAGLQQLCASMLDGLERLPPPQRDALRTAFGITDAPVPDRFRVGLAVLGLLCDVAEKQPLVCLVDDAQWLDRASLQALEFVGRRLFADAVGLVLAVRMPEGEQQLAGLPELLVAGLRNGDARALLGSAIGWLLDERVRNRIIAETRGNPLALLELPRGLTPAELAGGFGLPNVQPLPARIEESFRRRLQELPTETQRLLLVAAAEPVGEPVLVRRAANRLGVAAEAADAAESEGLVEFAAQVTFRHPLVRSAIYRAASPEDKRNAHRALAEVTDPHTDPDRRAWHLAQATSGPDEEVAAELERSAGRAQARGGLAATAAFLERAMALTLDPQRRAQRALAAAQANTQAGSFDAALMLLAAAEAGPLEELQRAQVDVLRGQIAFASRRGREAPPLLLAAARRLEPLDAELARDTYLEALFAATYAGRLSGDVGLLEVAEAARAAPPASAPPAADDLLLDGLALHVTEGPVRSAPTIKRAVSAFRDRNLTREQEMRWLWLASTSAQRLWDDESWELLSSRQVQLAQDNGALGVLPMALSQRAALHLHAGDFAAAARLGDDARTIADATGSQLPPYGPLTLAVFRGREVESADLIETSTRDLLRRGEGVGLTFVQWATAVLYNGLGRYEDALGAAQGAFEDPYQLLFSTWAMPEVVEAGARCGSRDLAAAAIERLADATRASGTEWALGLEACARALVSDGETAERLYREALDRLGRTRVRFVLARARLLYGEWLRRERRRADAREELRIAHEQFVTMGAEAFAKRAERELLAAGGVVHKRPSGTDNQLTAQESQVARLARDGLSNPEIGARLFISPRTVQYHLRKVFTKLDITSRMQLDGVLPGDPVERT